MPYNLSCFCRDLNSKFEGFSHLDFWHIADCSTVCIGNCSIQTASTVDRAAEKTGQWTVPQLARSQINIL